MISQLKKRPRLDHLKTEQRARKSSIGRWIYLGLLSLLVLWLINLALGHILFFQAEGFVMRTRQEAGAPFTAQVVELRVREGQNVQAGDSLAILHSPEYARDIAQIAIRIADLQIRITEITARTKVLESLLPFARKRADIARLAMSQLASEEGKQLATSQRVSIASKEEFESMEELSKISTEYETIRSQNDQLEQALSQARQTFATLNSLYANGEVRAIVSGTVASIPVAPGTVVTAGEPVMELLTGPFYILGYTNPGTINKIEVGDSVGISYGMHFLEGKVEGILPITATLPEEFQKAFRPKDRSQIIRISLEDKDKFPPLLTKVEISSAAAINSLIMRFLYRLHIAL